MYRDELDILEIFTEEDIKFNKKMIGCARNISNKRAKHINRPDVVNEILNDFRKKWGIHDDAERKERSN